MIFNCIWQWVIHRLACLANKNKVKHDIHKNNIMFTNINTVLSEMSSCWKQLVTFVFYLQMKKLGEYQNHQWSSRLPTSILKSPGYASHVCPVVGSHSTDIEPSMHRSWYSITVLQFTTTCCPLCMLVKLNLNSTQCDLPVEIMKKTRILDVVQVLHFLQQWLHWAPCTDPAITQTSSSIKTTSLIGSKLFYFETNNWQFLIEFSIFGVQYA